MKSLRYISTRGGIKPVSFREAVMMGLATDGGLLIPERIPDVRKRLAQWRALPYVDLAFAVMEPYVAQDLDATTFKDMIRRSYGTFSCPQVVPVVKAGPVFMAELFHGPTLAFKDVALQLLGNLFEHFLKDSGQRLNIVGATSGDTGSAAIYGVRGKANIDIFIMHPKGRVSPTQERQMTTVLDANVHNIAVEGTFDDGQRTLKEIFNDLPFKEKYRLGAVNSVNWARVLAQLVYYFHAAFRVQEQTGAEAVQVAVPTGNFGDIFAGYVAMRMGAPIRRLLLATNENDILTRFFTTGVYAASQVQPTLSPSMDIQVASNFERYLFYRVGKDAVRLAALMQRFEKEKVIEVQGTDPAFVAGTGNTADTLRIIRNWYEAHHYLMDPHTAVGVAVAERHLDPALPTVCLATAHPAKFSDAIVQALGKDLAHHPALEALRQLPTRCVVLPPEKAAVERYIAETLAGSLPLA